MFLWLILALIFAALELLANWKNNLRWLEFIAKPAVMICLLAWLYFTTDLKGNTFWFGVGIVFSLAGDVLLLWLDRLFLYGLIAFLFAHISYINGFRDLLMTISAWSVILIVIVVTSAVRVMRRITLAMRAKRETRMIGPVILYAVVISIMLYAAMLTLSEPAWKSDAALSVSLGAFLFYISDVILAWHKFVAPIPNGRLWNIASYHLGQIALIAGVVFQFSNT